MKNKVPHYMSNSKNQKQKSWERGVKLVLWVNPPLLWAWRGHGSAFHMRIQCQPSEITGWTAL